MRWSAESEMCHAHTLVHIWIWWPKKDSFLTCHTMGLNLAYLWYKSSLSGHFAKMVFPLLFRVCPIVAHFDCKDCGSFYPDAISLLILENPVTCDNEEAGRSHTNFSVALHFLTIAFPHLCLANSSYLMAQIKMVPPSRSLCQSLPARLISSLSLP